jgi:hypothetical protein
MERLWRLVAQCERYIELPLKFGDLTEVSKAAKSRRRLACCSMPLRAPTSPSAPTS